MTAIVQNELLKSHTTFTVGGPAEFFTVVHSEDELVEAVTYAKEKSLSVTVIGGGSNVLVSDTGVKGLVIQNKISEVTEHVDDTHISITVGAGMVFDDLVALTVEKGYWGLENLSHIPGSIGASPIQNIGAYGVEVGDYIEGVRVFDMDAMEFRVLSAKECAFTYRHSLFKTDEGSQLIVTAVTYILSTNPHPKITYKDLAHRFVDMEPGIQDIRTAIIEIRSEKFPDWTEVGTAGSFFKNPIISKEHFEKLHKAYEDLPSYEVSDEEIKIPLGWVLDKVCNLRGVRTGNVGTYRGQALVVINHGEATCIEIESFVSEIAKNVFDKTEIIVEWEVTKIS